MQRALAFFGLYEMSKESAFMDGKPPQGKGKSRGSSINRKPAGHSQH
jgi:hypothetical protein